ncbi:MAG: hypothetical protein AAGJ83_09755, partial [Planctomycetota bacterium]
FLKNFGPLHATLADMAAIMGLCLWKLRLLVGRKPNPDPPHLLTDLVRHSVLLTGYRIRPVENPVGSDKKTRTNIQLSSSMPTSTVS